MRRLVFLCLALCAMRTLYAQEGLFIGFGAEANGYTINQAAFGGGWSLGADLNKYIALGVKTTFSYDLESLTVMEQAGFFRFYLPLKKQGPFLQAEAGGSIFFEDNDSYLMFSGGIAAGWRFRIGKNWYVEPTARCGYPFVWGARLSFGGRIGSK
jgi:hypothetical protein